MEVNIHQAKTHLSSLLQRAAGGVDITIARAGVPVARLVAVEPPRAPRPLGMDGGRFKVPPDFNAPLPDELLGLFEGEKPKRVRRTGKRNRRRR
jgi:prevent-host-death family protein